MAINSVSNLSLRGNGIVDQAIPAKTEKTPSGSLPGKAVAEVDQVNLTTSSLRLRQIETQDKEGPPMDQAKIDKLRAVIASGEYQVDSGKLASKILDFEATFA
ncbi:MAG TPA: flagellar biosynthesis anti-sigma factor FlgM [Gammaproteobacteria bacterium]|nr:flagellar biosynthesis anti-sigma factor FlgM [Gammaproteobacteria bacterium]HRF45508.1 flagellar biosynthesis anti-sigma factor FlgM [Candidatus Competibacteraceae bacterium]